MKIELKQNNSEVLTNISGKKVNFKISSNTAKLFYMLRDGFYSKKIQTMVQEYISNAQDAHIMAKSNEPIRIVLPTESNPSLIIEDFGVGMNEEELIRFSSYLDSSKDNQDDPIGGFGIGGKIGFAYTDSFVVVSRKDGYERSFFANREETTEGTSYISEGVKTDLPNGTQIIIPIKLQDFEEVKRSVLRIAIFLKPTPLIVNNTYLHDEIKNLTSHVLVEGTSYKVIESNFDNYKFITKNLYGNDKNDQVILTISGIHYEISEKMKTDLTKKLSEKNLDSMSRILTTELLTYKPSYYSNEQKKLAFIWIQLKAKDLKVAGTREAIVDDEANFNLLLEKLVEIGTDLENQLREKVEKSKNLNETLNWLSDLTLKQNLPLNNYFDSINHLGEKLNFNNYTVYLEKTANVFELNLNTNSKYSNSNKITNIPIFNRNAKCFFADLKPETSWRSARLTIKNKTNIKENSIQLSSLSEKDFADIKRIMPEAHLFTFPVANKRINKDSIKVFRVDLCHNTFSDNADPSFVKNEVQLSVKDLEGKCCVVSEDFKKIVKNFKSGDNLVFKNNENLEIFLVSKNLFSLIKKPITIEKLLLNNINKNEVKNVATQILANDYRYFEVSDFLLYFNKNIPSSHLLNSKYLLKEGKISWNNRKIFSGFVKEAFRELFKEEVKELSSYAKKMLNKASFLDHVDFSSLSKNEIDQLWNLIQK